MKQVYLDSIIIKIKEDSGNDPDLRTDYVRRVVLDRMRDVIPGTFFPVSVDVLEVQNFILYPETEFLKIAAVDLEAKATIPYLCLYENNLYEPLQFIYPGNTTPLTQEQQALIAAANMQIAPSVTQVNTPLLVNKPTITIEGIGDCTPLGCYTFTEDMYRKQVSVATAEGRVSLFYYTLYKDRMGRVVVPEFAESYLISYGTMKAMNVLLNKGLRGRTPNLLPQTRYTLQDLRRTVTREFLSMQREINLLVEKVSIKPLNAYTDDKI